MKKHRRFGVASAIRAGVFVGHLWILKALPNFFKDLARQYLQFQRMNGYGRANSDEDKCDGSIGYQYHCQGESRPKQ